MNTAPTPKFAEMPPLIVALDTEVAADAIGRAQALADSELSSREKIGLKISRWHDQNIGLRETCLDTGLYTVLDTQLDDGIEEMALATRSVLSISNAAGRLLLPHAITMSRPKETVRSQKDIVQEKIFKIAHEQQPPVMVISHIDQTRMLPSDPNLQETDSVDSFSETRVEFDAIELHADTVLSHHFQRECQQAQNEGKQIPFFLASRFSFGQKENDHEAVVRRAAHAYRRGVRSIYLGQSIMQSINPEQVIEQVLAAHTDAQLIESSEEFNQLYPLPASANQNLQRINFA